MSVIRKILKWTGISLAALLVAGAVYQQIGLAMDARLAPPAHDMVLVDGHKMHVACSGQGDKTFILDAGAGAWSFEWFRIQPLLAKSARVCAFDRSGLGWSEPGGDADGRTASAQLASLVRAAHIPIPFYYVGHSLGANFAQIYFSDHPSDIAGLILLEPGMPQDLLEDEHASRADVMRASDCGVSCYAAHAVTFLGITRLAATFLIGHKTLSPDLRAQYVAGLGNSSTAATLARALAAVPKTAYQDLDVKSFGDTPVLIFDSTAPRDPEGNETVADVKIWKKGQLRYFAALAQKSSRGIGPVDVPDSTHSSMTLGQKQSVFVANQILRFAGAANGAS